MFIHETRRAFVRSLDVWDFLHVVFVVLVNHYGSRSFGKKSTHTTIHSFNSEEHNGRPVRKDKYNGVGFVSAQGHFFLYTGIDQAQVTTDSLTDGNDKPSNHSPARENRTGRKREEDRSSIKDGQ